MTAGGQDAEGYKPKGLSYKGRKRRELSYKLLL